jgi:hemolysin D
LNAAGPFGRWTCGGTPQLSLFGTQPELAADFRPSDDAVVKLETYPFTRYGTLSEDVIQVSPDAIVDEKRGLVFPVRVKLSRAHLTVDGRQALLSAGMSASVEIVTGKRRVIEFVWSPVAKAVSEAGRER